MSPLEGLIITGLGSIVILLPVVALVIWVNHDVKFTSRKQ